MAQPSRILIVNAKGGCGKTTVATNLAVAYARQGWRVALVDQDSQGSAEEWVQEREERHTKIEFVAQRRASMYQTQAWRNRLPEGVDRAIIDAASVAGERNLDDYFRECDAFLVPMLPSAIDIRAGAKFIDCLLNHRAYRSRPVPIGVVANRVVRGASAYEALTRFLDRLPVPTVATFSDCPLYLRAAELGAGILDFPHEDRFAAERGEWNALVRWVEGALEGQGATAQAAAPGVTPGRKPLTHPREPMRVPPRGSAVLANRLAQPTVGA